MKKYLLTLLSIMLVFAMLTGCSGDETTSSETISTTADNGNSTTSESEQKNDDTNDDTLFIGFSAGFTKVQHWQLEVLGAETAAKDNGVEFTYEYANGDPTKQVADVENMVEMGIDMLVVGPADSEGIVPTIESLKNKGVKVATSDIGVTGTDVAFHVASDNYAIGVSAAEYVADLLEEKGKIAIVGWAAASATADRESGFVDTINKYPDIEIVDHQDVQSDRQISLSTSESIIQANDDINLIFGANAECALGAYGATNSLNRNDIYVVSVDSDNEVMDAIINGTNLVATVTQDPYSMGYQAVSNAIKHLKGEAVEDIAIPHEVVTKENAQQIVERDQAYLAGA
jgi:ribose transport system substrate-binding protein